MMLFLLFGAMLMFALVMELGLLNEAQVQLQGAADAAALAGAVELMDNDILRPLNPADQADDIQDACREAADYVRRNVAVGVPLAIEAGRLSRSPNLVLAGGTLRQATHDRRFIPDDGSGRRVDTLQVCVQRSAEHDNPVTLWFSSLLGLAQANSRAAAEATLEQRILGFRPTRQCHIPMLPLAAPATGSSEAWISQAFAVPVSGRNDRFHVDPHTGETVAGHDGIPEIELRPAHGNVVTLRIGTPWQTSRAVGQMVAGLSAEDVAPHGGQLTLGSPTAPLRLSATSGIEASVASAARGILGQRRIWPLFGAPAADGHVDIIGFAAGSIVDLRRDAGQWVLLVQPCLLVTTTALTATTDLAPYNPWIAKLALTR